MAHDGDVESPARDDERTPLLGDDQPDQEQDLKSNNSRQIGWYIWRISLAIVAAFILAVFIKGWIDAGSDVDVIALISLSTSSLCR